MSTLKATEIAVGVRGQNIFVRGTAPPLGDNRYGSEEEIDLSLPLARELYRLLGAMIGLAERGGEPAEVVALADSKDVE